MSVKAASGVIPNGTVVQLPFTATQVTISQGATGNSAVGDAITFSDTNHPNLLKRWKYFLRYELDFKRHHDIRAAILAALKDNTIKHIEFDTVEDELQLVHASVEHHPTDDGSKLDLATKHMKIVLMTPLTRAPDPLDTPQTN